LQVDRGEHASAAVHLKEGLALCDRHGLVSTRGLILANLTELALKTGDADAAQTHARRALEVAALTGNRAIESWLKLQFVRIALRHGDLSAARTDLRASLEIAMAIGRPSLQLAGVARLRARGTGPSHRRRDRRCTRTVDRVDTRRRKREPPSRFAPAPKGRSAALSNRLESQVL
ncbi:hypothetical protein, partial [Piscinibacter sp.]|uniref:hypothetical protein n=1 Tax=Piscinibacter sp. TaxID=1903157 RepID=UPI0035594D29